MYLDETSSIEKLDSETSEVSVLSLIFNDMSEIIIPLPPLSVQQKYVNIYNSMLANQRCYERGLEDLKLTCDAYIENLRRKTPTKKIGAYLMQSDRRNDIGLSVDFVRGLATSKAMIPTKADMDGVSLNNYKVVPDPPKKSL